MCVGGGGGEAKSCDQNFVTFWEILLICQKNGTWYPSRDPVLFVTKKRSVLCTSNLVG